MTYIEISGKNGKGYRTIVDEEVYKLYGHLKWHMSSSGYAVRRSCGVTTSLHRLVIGAKVGKVADHLNGKKLDNRIANLRETTYRENNLNRKGVKGACYDKSRDRWLVTYRSKFYGRYDTEEEATQVFKKAKSGLEYVPANRRRYMLPKGVYFYKGYKKPYAARPQIKGVRHFLGYFATAEEAKAAYINFRQKEL